MRAASRPWGVSELGREVETEKAATSASFPGALLPFFWGEGSPTKIDYRKRNGALILTSLLENGNPQMNEPGYTIRATATALFVLKPINWGVSPCGNRSFCGYHSLSVVRGWVWQSKLPPSKLPVGSLVVFPQYACLVCLRVRVCISMSSLGFRIYFFSPPNFGAKFRDSIRPSLSHANQSGQRNALPASGQYFTGLARSLQAPGQEMAALRITSLQLEMRHKALLW